MAKMDIAPADRPKVKAECLRLLVTLQLDPAKSLLISSFVDTYLRMNPAEEQTFQAEVAKLEPQQQEKVMEVITSWEQAGREKGLKEGLKEGLEEGLTQASQAIALKMLNKQFPLETIAELTGLTVEQLQGLPQQAEADGEESKSG
jgi:predicted transposase/invertase (TIGR01784 family)